MFDTLAKNTLAPLLLRLALAAIFIYHGLEKVATEGNAAGLEWYKKQEPKPDQPPPPDPPPAPLQALVAWGELLGGIALGLGFLTRVAAAGILLIMAGAIYTVTGKHFDLRQGGYEYNLAIIAMCACLVLMGGGRLAVDRIFRLRRRQA